jgi:hypothetical protein
MVNFTGYTQVTFDRVDGTSVYVDDTRNDAAGRVLQREPGGHLLTTALTSYP